jgi:hypothetical protein
MNAVRWALAALASLLLVIVVAMVLSLPSEGYTSFLVAPATGALVLALAILLFAARNLSRAVGYGALMLVIGFGIAAGLLYGANDPTMLKSGSARDLKASVERAKANPVRRYFAGRTISRQVAHVKEAIAEQRTTEMRLFGKARIAPGAGRVAQVTMWTPTGFWTGDWSPVLDGLKSTDEMVVSISQRCIAEVISAEGATRTGKTMRKALEDAVPLWQRRAADSKKRGLCVEPQMLLGAAQRAEYFLSTGKMDYPSDRPPVRSRSSKAVQRDK